MSCLWKLDGKGKGETACGQSFTVTSTGYCPYCGKFVEPELSASKEKRT